MARKKTHRIFKTRNFGLILGLVFSVLFTVAGFSWKIFGSVEGKLLDSYFFIKHLQTRTAIQKGVWKAEENPAVSSDILIVGVDLRTLQKFGSWPFPRSVHANLLDSFSRIQDQSTRENSILLDFFFVDDSGIPENDQLLEESIARSGTVFLESILDIRSNGNTIDEEMRSRQGVLDEQIGTMTNIQGNWKEMPILYGLQTNLEFLNRAANGYGMANVNSDFADQIVRKQSLVFRYSQIEYEFPVEELTSSFVIDEANFERLSWVDATGLEHEIDYPLTDKAIKNLTEHMYESAPPLTYDSDGDGNPDTETRAVQLSKDTFYPSIAFALALDYWNTDLSQCTVVPGKHIIVNRSSGQNTVIPIDEKCAMLINYAGYPSAAAADGYRTFPVRSYSGYVRETSDDPETWPQTRAVDGKVILVGAFEHGMADDVKQTPFGMMFGIELHANSLNTLLTGNHIVELPVYVSVILTVLFIMGIAFIASRMRNIWSVPILLVVLSGTFLLASTLFDNYNLLINYPVPFFGMVITYVSIMLYRASTEERDKKKIRAMFGKYVSPEVVTQMIDNPPELGGVDRELTVFFSDIRGFTSLSETLTPQELVKHLNEYLSAMTDIIIETGGTLDKYVGDEVMCFWGAPIEVPDHAYQACRCALLQKEKLASLNEQWPTEKRLAIGIGLNTGIMTVGNMGSPGRMNYTLMGDNVNLGARLEGTNKIYGTMIIVSEYTYALVKDRFVFRELDTIRVKGKNRPVVIYELVDWKEA